MPKLYSYCIPYDNGSAPNPFWDICTLVICKPVIRRTAQVNDWIVATGSTNYGFANMVVYAMEVTEKMTMQEYDEYCKMNFPKKIPDWKSKIFEERIGDCIYDFSKNPSIIRDSVHNESNRNRDLGGDYALISNHFYYFGSKPQKLPEYLLEIVRQGQGHKSTSNSQYFHPFTDWILEKTWAKNKVFAEPHSKQLFEIDQDYKSKCAIIDKYQDDIDEETDKNLRC